MTPYASSASIYVSLGWSPIPLPLKDKNPPVPGYTGAHGAWVTEAIAAHWSKDRARYNAKNATFLVGNVGLRLPQTVVGIDVDMYNGKAGAATLAAAEKKWGKLPATWVSTSRTDGSGIRLFVVPAGLAWPESLVNYFGGGVEILRWDHRFAIVHPSIHPDTEMPYLWYTPAGVVAEDEAPAVDELPELPQAWVDGLTEGKEWEARAEADLSDAEVTAWLAARSPDEAPCDVMTKTVIKYSRLIERAGVDGGAHDVARDGAWAVIRDASQGHTGVAAAIDDLQVAFFTAVKGRRGKRVAADEWARSVNVGVRKVAAEGEPATEDMCDVVVSWTPSRVGSHTFDYTRDDIGNAQRFVNQSGHDMRYVEGLGGWHIWSGSRWEPDLTGQVHRWAFEMVRAMEKEAQYIEEPRRRDEFVKFIRASGQKGKVDAMISFAAKMKGMSLRAEDFDSDPARLLCPNGVLELGDTWVTFRPAQREDLLTKSTAAPYNEHARFEQWDKFLAQCMPDPEVRAWTQKAIGYSIFGGNPNQLFFMVVGKTGSGKTTLAEAVMAALGDYGGPYDLTLFRSAREQGANVQLVRLMDTRFIVADEASADWVLHGDQVKRVTGGSTISGRLNWSNNMVEKKPAFTPWITCNFPPTINGADQALYRRMYAIPFDAQVPVGEEDVALQAVLRSPEGAAAVLAWVVEGWRRYGQEGLRAGDAPSAVLLRTLRVRDELSEFDAFLVDCCVRGTEEGAVAKDLYTAYVAWAEETHSRIETLTSFGRDLTKRGIDKEHMRLGGEQDLDGRQKKVWVRLGIKLKPSWLKRIAGTGLRRTEGGNWSQD